MKIKSTILSLLLIAAFSSCLLPGCSQNVAGGGTDYPNTKTVAGIARNSQGEPVNAGRVLLIDKANWLRNTTTGRPVVLDSAVIGETGTFSIRVPMSVQSNLQIDCADQALLVRDFTENLDTTVSEIPFSLRPCAAISGVVTSDSGTPQTVRLEGSAYSAAVNPNSTYSASAVAEGTFPLLTQLRIGTASRYSLGSTFPLASGASVTGADISAPASRTLVDDFSMGWSRTNLGRVLGDGWWYKVTDAKWGGQSSVSADTASGAGAYSGTSMHARYILDKNGTGAWAIAGFFVGRSTPLTPYDFSNVTAVSFQAKGKGNVNVKLLTTTLSDLTNDSTHYYYNVAIPPVWTRIVVPMDSLRLPATASAEIRSHTWQQVRESVQIIDFNVSQPETAAGDTVDLWLDDITLEGVTMEDFVR